MNEWNKTIQIFNTSKMERGTSGTVFAIRRKIIKINKIMGARVYAHARKGFIGAFVPHFPSKSIRERLK